MSDHFVGQVCLLPYRQDDISRGLHLCDGSPLRVAHHQIRFRVLGTQCGGDCAQTFGLHGRAPVGAGVGPGLPPYGVGQAGVTPENPTGNVSLYIAQTVSPATSPALVTLGGGLTPTAGRSAPLATMPPCLAMNHFVALNGAHPALA